MASEYQQLLKPESLSESALIDILKSRFIELPNVKDLKKSDLIEMYCRIALPMPQRRYNEAKYLGKKLSDLRMSRNISIATEEEQTLYESMISSRNESLLKSDCKKFKLSSEDSSPKKERYLPLNSSSDERYGSPENGMKRKCNDKEVSPQADGKKRQKITWP